MVTDVIHTMKLIGYNPVIVHEMLIQYISDKVPPPHTHTELLYTTPLPTEQAALCSDVIRMTAFLVLRFLFLPFEMIAMLLQEYAFIAVLINKNHEFI